MNPVSQNCIEHSQLSPFAPSASSSSSSSAREAEASSSSSSAAARARASYARAIAYSPRINDYLDSTFIELREKAKGIVLQAQASLPPSERKDGSAETSWILGLTFEMLDQEKASLLYSQPKFGEKPLAIYNKIFDKYVTQRFSERSIYIGWRHQVKALQAISQVLEKNSDNPSERVIPLGFSWRRKLGPEDDPQLKDPLQEDEAEISLPVDLAFVDLPPAYQNPPPFVPYDD